MVFYQKHQTLHETPKPWFYLLMEAASAPFHGFDAQDNTLGRFFTHRKIGKDWQFLQMFKQWDEHAKLNMIKLQLILNFRAEVLQLPGRIKV